jgi:biotin operon repressor
VATQNKRLSASVQDDLFSRIQAQASCQSKVYLALRDGIRAFSSEVDTGSREENAIKQRPREFFRFNRIGKCSRKMNVYSGPDPVMSDEQKLSDRLGVSRTPIRGAIAMLEQDGLLRIVTRRGILVPRKTKRETIEIVQAWASLESFAASRPLVPSIDYWQGGSRTTVVRRPYRDHLRNRKAEHGSRRKAVTRP